MSVEEFISKCWQGKSANFVIRCDSMVEFVCKREGGMERSLALPLVTSDDQPPKSQQDMGIQR